MKAPLQSARKQSAVRKPSIKKSTQKASGKKKAPRTPRQRELDGHAAALNWRATYEIGQHGAKKREQRRLSEAYGISVTGDSHESEHTIGFEPLIQTTGLERQVGTRAQQLENRAPAYQEVKEFHRDHIGTGNSGRRADPKRDSGFSSQSYRHDQRALLEAGDVSSASQLNQLDYAFMKDFRTGQATPEKAAANDSFNTMVANTRQVTYGDGEQNVTVGVDAKARAEMYLSRIVAQTGKWPTVAQENEARTMFGLNELPDMDVE